MLGFFLSQIETVVDEAPSKVLDVQLAVTVVVHGAEDPCDALDATAGALQDLGLDLSDQVFNAECLELLHGHGVASVGCVADEPDILVVLELGWHVTRQVALVLECKVLGSVKNGE